MQQGKENLELKAQGQMYFAPVDKVGRKLSVNQSGMDVEVDTIAEVFKGKLIWIMVADLSQRQRKLSKLSAAEVAAQTDAAAALLESMGLS
jgi:hypothetical protein